MGRNSQCGRGKGGDGPEWNFRREHLLGGCYWAAMAGLHHSRRQDLLRTLVHHPIYYIFRVRFPLRKHHILRLTRSPSANKAETPLHSLSAFRHLENSCLSEGVSNECTALALATVLMSPHFRAGPINLPAITPSKSVRHHTSVDGVYYERLSKSLSRCITLSCCHEGISSLLCSPFFEPKIPCNLIGAHSSGARKAVEPAMSDPKLFARLVAKQNPKVSAFWLAAILMGHGSKYLNSALGGMPPICLPIASWTGFLQSFVQVGYDSISNRDGFCTRAQEFTTTFLIRPTAPMPFTTPPPFGEIEKTNISLQVQKHLRHDHRILKSMTYWISRDREFHPVSERPDIAERPFVRLPHIARASDNGIKQAQW